MCNEHLVSFTENVAAFSTEDYGPPGPNPKHNPHPPPHPAHVVALYSPPTPPGMFHHPLVIYVLFLMSSHYNMSYW